MDRWIVKLLGLVALAACDSDVDPIDCVPLPPNALHWWTGDGDGKDRIGTAHATLMHGVEFAPGLVESGGGQAFSFDGIDAFARVDDAPTLNPTGPFSIVVWARPGPNPFSATIIGKGHSWQESWVLGHLGGYWIGFIRSAEGYAVRARGPKVDPGVWTHLVMRWNGTSVSLLVDGVLWGATPVNSIRQTNVYVGIGSRSEEGFDDDEVEHEFTGEVDEILFFDRALGEAEIRDVFEAAENGICKS